MRGDRTTDTGLIVVAAAAAVMSFTALAGLARLAGLDGHFGPLELAWLFPVAVDAYAVTVTRVWLRGRSSDKAYNWARANSLAAIAASMAGNAAFHADPSSARPWVVAVVAAFPPLMLGAAVHTKALVSEDRARAQARLDARSQTRSSTGAEDRPGRGTGTGTKAGTGARAKTGTKTGTATDAATGTKTGTDAQRLELVPPQRGAAEQAMREFWVAERAAGRTPSGAALARVGHTSDSYGRKKCRAWSKAEQDEAETAEAVR